MIQPYTYRRQEAQVVRITPKLLKPQNKMYMHVLVANRMKVMMTLFLIPPSEKILSLLILASRVIPTVQPT